MSQTKAEIWQAVYFGRNRSRRDTDLPSFPGDGSNWPEWLIASGSPRGGRLADVLPGRTMVLPTSGVGNLLMTCSLPPGLANIADVISSYQERPGRWNPRGTGRPPLPQEKGQIVLAGIGAWMLATGRSLKRIPIILAKDFTIALFSKNGAVFLDGGFSPRQQMQLMENFRDNKGNLLIVSCNATTGLRVDGDRPLTVGEIGQLVDLSGPLPDRVRAKTINTFTVLQVGPWVFDRGEPYTLPHLVDHVERNGWPPGHVSLPGIGDFAVPWFAQAVHVFYPFNRSLGNPTGHRFEPLAEAALAGNGYWACFSLENAVHREIGDELVGAPIPSARFLSNGLLN